MNISFKNIKATALAAIAISMGLASCDSQLDIVPKGKTTLDNVSDLETLLNQEYSLNEGAGVRLGLICNEGFGAFISVPEKLAQKATAEYAYYAYDESIDRANLTSDDPLYQAAYKYINYANVVISKTPDASGDASIKPQLIAEAKIIRAYMHFLLVNIYAKQYDKATADKEGGIAYVDNTNVSEPKTKLSLQETYDRILEDCSDEVIANLVEKNDNVERPDRALGNAVRAYVLRQMKRYDEAIPYAQASLKLNGNIEDRSKVAETGIWELPNTLPDNLLYVRPSTRVSPTFYTITGMTLSLFEEGDYIINSFMDTWDPMYGEMFSGIPGTAGFSGWDTYGNDWGLTSDRMYYLLAECLIRTGKTQEGLALVDRVRKYRVENAEPFAAANVSEKDAMAMMQKAKWIECISTFENFFDCKRWNTEDGYARSLTHELGEYGNFTIKPNSPLWVLPFPLNVTRMNPSLTQNY